MEENQAVRGEKLQRVRKREEAQVEVHQKKLEEMLKRSEEVLKRHEEMEKEQKKYYE